MRKKQRVPISVTPKALGLPLAELSRNGQQLAATKVEQPPPPPVASDGEDEGQKA